MKKEITEPSPLETETIDVGPLNRMAAEKQPDPINKLKDAQKQVKIDPLTHAKQSKALIEDRVFMSRLAEQACCYEDMIEFLSDILDAKTSEFTVEERNLFSVAFKNFIENDKQSLEMVHDIQDFDNFQKFQKVLAIYRNRIEKLL